MWALLAFLVLFPILPLLISTVMGGLLALVEGVTFREGFLYVASNLLSMATNLTDYNPNDPAGIMIDVYVSVVALLLFGIVINVVNLFRVPEEINRTIERFVKGRILVPAIALGFVVPLLVALIAVVCGSILGVAEGWSVRDGILYVFSNLLSLGTPLTDVLPTTMVGDIIDIIISSMALGCVAVFVDYVTCLNPARYIRKRTTEFLEQRGLLETSIVGNQSGETEDERSNGQFSNHYSYESGPLGKDELRDSSEKESSVCDGAPPSPSPECCRSRSDSSFSRASCLDDEGPLTQGV